MFQLFGCSAREKGGLTYFRYSHNNSMISNGSRAVTVELLDNDTALVTVKDECGEPRSVKTSSAVITEVEEIVNKHKMYRYNGFYRPAMDVLDGWDWDFFLKYNDGSTTHAHGYMKYPKDGRAAFGEADAVIRKWAAVYADGGKPANVEISGRMTSFRYERYSGGKSKVYYISKTDYFTGLYCRKMGSAEGYYYTDGDSTTLKPLEEIVLSRRLAMFPQTPLDKENVKRDRWLVEAEFAGGAKIQIVEYIPEKPYDYDLELDEKVDEIFKAAEGAIWDKPLEQRGEYSITTYLGGKPQRKINYSGDGRVLNGQDYNDPYLTF